MTVSSKTIPTDLLDALMSNYQSPEDLIGANGLLKQLTKAIVERALEAEMTAHLGHDKHEAVTNATGNARNGKSRKTLKGDFGDLPIEIPRDRQGDFEPQIIAKHQRRWTGFDDKIVSLYARGLSAREIQAHLFELYGTEVSPSLISSVTDAVLEEVAAWQSRPLDPLYPIVYLDCLYTKIRDSGSVKTKAVYLAIGVNLEGRKEVLGLWIAQSEGAKFWLQVVTELKNRGVNDILIASATAPALPYLLHPCSRASMVSKAFPKPSKPCSPKPPCNCASSTWSATASTTSATKSVRRWLTTSSGFIKRPPPWKPNKG